MKNFLFFFFMTAAACIFAAKPFEGPWTSEGTIFYLVHPGGPLKIDIDLKKAPGYMGNPVLKNTPSSLLILMDPDDQVAAEKYWRVAPGEKAKKYTLNIPNAKAGVWQIRNTFAFSCNMSLQFKTTPKLEYGVLFSRSRILTKDMENIRNSYFLVPKPVTPLNLKQPTVKDRKKTIQKLHLGVRNRQYEILDKHGRIKMTADIYEIVSAMSDIYCNSNIDLPFGSTERVSEAFGPNVVIRREDRSVIAQVKQNSSVVLPLKENNVYQMLVNIPKTTPGMIDGPGYLAVDGFPVIFCPNPATARKINASIVKASDGRQFAYRFQKDMYEWIKSLKKSDLEIKPVPISKFKKEWFADPKSYYLLRYFAYAEHMFRSQVTDPEDIAFGTAPMNLDQLTLLYTLKKPYNPYYGNKALMNRIFLLYFRKWLSLSESGAFHDDPEHGAYCGGLEWTGWEGMVFTADYTTLAMMTPLADKKLLNIWAEAMKFPIYRFWCHRLTCENQSLHWPLKEYAMYMATGNQLFKTLANDYLNDLADPELSRSMKTGYYMEAYGMDGTYQGISASLLAFGVRFAKDNTALKSLRKLYDLMAHTVVKEPDGTLASVNGYGHRTAGTWLNAQYGGGVCLLDDILEDAAAISMKHINDQKLTENEFRRYSNTKFPKDLTKWCKTAGKNMFGYGISCWLPVWFRSILPIGKKLKNAKLPIERSKDFERNFNDEFYAHRTPAYYTFFYTGNYSWRRRYLRQIQTPLLSGTSIKNGEVFTANASTPWMSLQGLQLFWTPKFGIFVSAHNWSMYSQYLVRAERNGKVVDFITATDTESELKKNKVELKQKTKFLKLKVEREVELKNGKIEMEVEVSAPEKMAPVKLIEQIPYRIKPDLKFIYYSGNRSSGIPGKNITALKVTRANGSAIMIRFERPVTVRQGMRSSAVQNYPKFHIGLLEIEFDASFDGSKDAKINYSISGEEI